jgi:hypothetical protein
MDDWDSRRRWLDRCLRPTAAEVDSRVVAERRRQLSAFAQVFAFLTRAHRTTRLSSEPVLSDRLGMVRPQPMVKLATTVS